MPQINFKDSELAMDYIKKNRHSEYIEFDIEPNGILSMTFIDKSQKFCKIFLYEANKGITPEVRVTTKLYKKE